MTQVASTGVQDLPDRSAGALVSTVLRDFHASVLGIAFGPVDTIFTGMGLLAVIGGNLRASEPTSHDSQASTWRAFA